MLTWNVTMMCLSSGTTSITLPVAESNTCFALTRVLAAMANGQLLNELRCIAFDANCGTWCLDRMLRAHADVYQRLSEYFDACSPLQVLLLNSGESREPGSMLDSIRVV
jgi:hypothetical protein